VYYALHKPDGVVCTNRDPAGRPRAIDLVPAGDKRLFTVGRLDLHSEGLIVLTNDGELANRLTHPRYGVQKTYRVLVAGEPERDVLDRLRRGVRLAEGVARVAEIRIRQRLKQSTWLEIVLDEGRNRHIRRVLARVGYRVLRLIRIAIGPLRLGEMPAGAHRPLTRKEVDSLRRAAQAPGAGPRRRRAQRDRN
jgi:23S rRNA pseudouridine2605 synthase